jgi:hypothetical protein
MRRFKMCASMGELVILDNDETSYEEVKREVVGREVCDGAFSFLGCGMGGLEDENGFCED